MDIVGETVIESGTEWLFMVAAIFTSVSVIIVSSLKVKRVADKFDQFLDDWNGTLERDGVPAHPGVMARLAASDTDRTELRRVLDRVEESQGQMQTELRDLSSSQRATDTTLREVQSSQTSMKDRLDYELSINGGGSLRDEVRELGVATAENSKAIQQIQKTVNDQNKELGS